MYKINYRALSLSDLSFIILSNHMPPFVIKDAYSEIKRRFKNNACDYEEFIAYEEAVIKKRGDDIENYLIATSTAKQLMEIYFNYVYGQGVFIHDNLLFSEVHLFNADNKNTFFSKVLELEINNLRKRIYFEKKAEEIDEEELIKLKLIFGILNNQKSEKSNDLKHENAAKGFVYDICHNNFIYGPRQENKLYSAIDKASEGDIFSKIYLYANIPIILLKEKELIEYLLIHKFILADSMRLQRQKRQIIEDLRSDKPVEYSFIDTSLILSKIHSKNM